MLLDAKLNKTAHKMLQSEAVHMCERVHNSMSKTNSTKIPFENFNKENPRSLVRSQISNVLCMS